MREPLKDRIRLEHIAEAADNISRYTAGKTYEDIHKGDGSLCVLFYLCNYPGKIVHTGAACALWYLFTPLKRQNCNDPLQDHKKRFSNGPLENL